MYKIVVSMLPVGQGAMNLIEVYRKTGFKDVLIGLTMIDCGHDGRGAPKDLALLKTTTLRGNTFHSVRYAADLMRERFEVGDGLYLDNLIITHGDKDHWNLFDKLLLTLFGANHSIVDGASDCVGTNYELNNKNNNESFYMDELKEICIYEYQKHVNDEYCEISETITYQYNKAKGEENVKTTLVYRNVISECIFQAEWGTAGLHMKAYSPEYKLEDGEKDEEQKQLAGLILDVDVDAENEAEGPYYLVYGYFFSEWNYKKDPGTLPDDNLNVGKLIATLARSYLGEYPQFNSIQKIMDFMNEGFYLISKDQIRCKIMEGTKVSNIIGHTFVGGYIKADRNKQVNKMLSRARLASGNRYAELKKGNRIPILGNVFLLVLERLSTGELISIKVPGGVKEYDDGIINNATSAVSVLTKEDDDAFQKFLFTGDATAHTFYKILNDEGPALFHNAVWTAPHHGAQRTIAGQVSVNEQKWELLELLLTVSEPKGMVISAGMNTMHGHPNVGFIKYTYEYFQKACESSPEHSICFNPTNQRSKKWYYSCISFPLYTSMEAFDCTIIYFLNYQFIIDDEYAGPYDEPGKTELYRFDNRAGEYDISKYSRLDLDSLFAEDNFLQAEEIPTDTLFMNGSRAAF